MPHIENATSGDHRSLEPRLKPNVKYRSTPRRAASSAPTSKQLRAEVRKLVSQAEQLMIDTKKILRTR